MLPPEFLIVGPRNAAAGSPILLAILIIVIVAKHQSLHRVLHLRMGVLPTTVLGKTSVLVPNIAQRPPILLTQERSPSTLRLRMVAWVGQTAFRKPPARLERTSQQPPA